MAVDAIGVVVEGEAVENAFADFAGTVWDHSLEVNTFPLSPQIPRRV